jgi:hypothetical protein
MKSISIKAKFKGQDKSLGYRKWKVYYLFFWINEEQFVCISSTENPSVICPYENLWLFLQNWEVIR